MADGTDRAAAQPIDTDPAIAADEEPAAAVRRMVSEDWAATIIGLVLLGLALIGVITKGMVP